MNHDDIWKEKLKLDKDRRSKLSEFLDDYDSKVYDPSIKMLRENCEKLGHKYVFRDYNFMRTHEIHYCEYCGDCKHEEINLLHLEKS